MTDRERVIDRQLASLAAEIIQARKIVEEARDVADSARASIGQMSAINRAKIEDHERRLRVLEKKSGRKVA